MNARKRFSQVLVLGLCCLLLCGCTRKIELSAGKFPEDCVNITAVIQAEDLPLLDRFPQLQSVDFSGSSCYEEILAWAQQHPQIKLRYTVLLPDGQSPDNHSTQLDLRAMDGRQLQETLPLLSYLPALSSLQLPDNLEPEQLLAFAEAYPALRLRYCASVLGKTLTQDTTQLDMSALKATEVEELVSWLPLLPELEHMALGSEDGRLSWDDLSVLAAACPQTVLDYDFSLYGKSFSLADSSMDLNHIEIGDEGALVAKITPCMRNLSYLDMDSCGVSDEAMAKIRDALPNTEVVWRIWFGERYSVRTNVERILASNPGMGGELTGENTGSLRYCTKVRYLDLGHNAWLDDISFVSCMPDLEVAVLAMGNWADISGLANCPKLEYAELQTSCLNDLRPLKELENLRHLNIAYCMALTDITPLFEMPALERLWIGCLTPIPKEQVAQYKALFPDCEVNTSTLDPTEGSWRRVHTQFGLRDVPRYELLRDQFQYQLGIDAYSYFYNDPLY